MELMEMRWPIFYGSLLGLIWFVIYFILCGFLGNKMKNGYVQCFLGILFSISAIACSEYTYQLHHPSKQNDHNHSEIIESKELIEKAKIGVRV